MIKKIDQPRCSLGNLIGVHWQLIELNQHKTLKGDNVGLFIEIIFFENHSDLTAIQI